MSQIESIPSCESNIIKNSEIPEEFLFLTEHCNICFLSTSRENCPDIYMMFFTYHKNDNVILLTTKKDKKYDDIVSNPNVSVLIHSLEGKASNECSFQDQKHSSVTVTAKAFFADKEKESEYKELQISSHPKWADAFKGEDKSVIVIPVEKLTIVDIKDKITTWNIKCFNISKN